MNVLPVKAFIDNYIWMIINQENRKVCCVDPGEAQPVVDFLITNNLQLDTILLTHHHFDHIGGSSQLHELYPNSKIFAPNDHRIPNVTNIIQNKDLINFYNYQFQVLSTPGHTATHVSFYNQKQQWLFCGDTLFSAGCGRVFDGTIKDLFNSLEKLKSLPDHTAVYAAHEYTHNNLLFAQTVEPQNKNIKSCLAKLTKCTLPSTIAQEKLINPFLRTNLPNLQTYALKNGNTELDAFSIFTQLRNAKDNF